MPTFFEDEIQECSFLLSRAKSPSDALGAWSSLEAKHPYLKGLVSLESYKRESVPPSIKNYTKKPKNYLIPYFSSENIYFLDDEIIKNMFISKKIFFDVDYTLMFDTNISTYINKLVKGESLGSVQNDIVPLIHDLLYDDLNFDFIFYMIENVKNILWVLNKDITSKFDFWKNLDKKFRENMVSLQVFRSIDCKEYKKTLSPKPNFTYVKAVRNAVDYCYYTYGSKFSKEGVSHFVYLQRIVLLHLIGIIRIQLESNKSPKNKMSQYFDFMHNTIGAYFDREAIVAHIYFKDRSLIKDLEKIKKGCSKVRLLRRIDNIAWDMTAPRFMETFISHGGEGRYMIPFFLTLDNGLKQTLELFPVKAAIYNDIDKSLVPIPQLDSSEYFEKNGCIKDLEYYFSEEMRGERANKPKPTKASIHNLIKMEYKKLRKLI